MIDEHEPLATAELDDFLDPRVLRVAYEDGLCDAETARIDVQWTTSGDYAFHYTDSADVDLRWGKHPHGGEYTERNALEHYHPPPNASSDPDDVEESCIGQSRPFLVTRAVLKLWRRAFRVDSLAPLNAGRDPP